MDLAYTEQQSNCWKNYAWFPVFRATSTWSGRMARWSIRHLIHLIGSPINIRVLLMSRVSTSPKWQMYKNLVRCAIPNNIYRLWSLHSGGFSFPHLYRWFLSLAINDFEIWFINWFLKVKLLINYKPWSMVFLDSGSNDSQLLVWVRFTAGKSWAGKHQNAGEQVGCFLFHFCCGNFFT